MIFLNRPKLSCAEGDSEELLAVFGIDPKLYTEEGKEKESERLPDNHLGRVFFNLR